MSLNDSSLLKKDSFHIAIWGCVCCIFYMAIQDYVAVPWKDEIGTSDTAINYVLFGNWDSSVWLYTYNPLHAFCLIAWLNLFGISHSIVCNLNIFFALIGFLCLERELFASKLLVKRTSGYALTLLYWLGYMMAHIMTNGRIDTLVMLLTIVLGCQLLKPECRRVDRTSIFFSSTLLIMSSIYIIPLVVIIILLFFVLNFQDQGRRIWFIKGGTVVFGFVIGMVITCFFYYKISFLCHFLSTYISFNKSLANDSYFFTRLLESYGKYRITTALCVVACLLYNLLKVKDKTIRLLLVIVMFIPAIMTVVGRYQSYYVWMVELGTSVLITILIDRTGSRRIKTFIFSIVVAFSLIRPTYWLYIRPSEYKQRKELYTFLDNNKELLSKYDNVFFRDADCYYKLVEFKLKRYYLLYDNYEVNATLANLLHTYVLPKGYKEYYPNDFLPSEGVMISTPKWPLKKGCEELVSHTFTYNVLVQTEKWKITHYKKVSN